MPIRDLKAQIARLPEQPGVYVYYNDAGDTLYVGKARVLRDRVRPREDETVHERDEELLANGTLTPTHMFAVMAREAEPLRCHARGLAPEQSVRQR